MAYWLLDLFLLVAMLVLFNIAARTRRLNPPVRWRLVCLVLGVMVFGAFYGTFFALCRLVVLPRVLGAVEAGSQIGFAENLLARLGGLDTMTIVLGYIFGCFVIYASIELVIRKLNKSDESGNSH